MIKKIASFVFMFGLSAALIVFPLVSFLSDVGAQNELLDSGYHLITLSLEHGYLPGVVVGGVSLLLFSVGAVVFQWQPRLHHKFFVPASVALAVLGLALVVLGAITARVYWFDTIAEQGYTQCDERQLLGVSRMHRSLWVKEPELCTNPQIARILRYANREELEQVHRLLESQEATP